MAPQSTGQQRFLGTLTHLSRPEIADLAACLRFRRGTDDLLAWWQETVLSDRALRRQHRSLTAPSAALLARQAVLAAADQNGMPVDSADVIGVARAALESARSHVAGTTASPGALWVCSDARAPDGATSVTAA